MIGAAIGLGLFLLVAVVVIFSLWDEGPKNGPPTDGPPWGGW